MAAEVAHGRCTDLPPAVMAVRRRLRRMLRAAINRNTGQARPGAPPRGAGATGHGSRLRRRSAHQLVTGRTSASDPLRGKSAAGGQFAPGVTLLEGIYGRLTCRAGHCCGRSAGISAVRWLCRDAILGLMGLNSYPSSFSLAVRLPPAVGARGSSVDFRRARLTI